MVKQMYICRILAAVLILTLTLPWVTLCKTLSFYVLVSCFREIMSFFVVLATKAFNASRSSTWMTLFCSTSLLFQVIDYSIPLHYTSTFLTRSYVSFDLILLPSNVIPYAASFILCS